MSNNSVLIMNDQLIVLQIIVMKLISASWSISFITLSAIILPKNDQPLQIYYFNLFKIKLFLQVKVFGFVFVDFICLCIILTFCENLEQDMCINTIKICHNNKQTDHLWHFCITKNWPTDRREKTIAVAVAFSFKLCQSYVGSHSRRR